jgi:predicted RNA-binding protein with PIN domain
VNDAPTRPAAADLPDPVRARLVALVAASLPAVAQLPAALRRVADFAPARRAKVGASAIIQALDADDELRERVAVQVQDRITRETGRNQQPDPVEGAALAWLTRPEGWADSLREAVQELEQRAEPEPGASDQLARLRERLEQAETTGRELRASHREQLAQLKAEVTDLRRKLGEARASDRSARAAAEEALSGAEASRASAEERLAAQEKELRQLRGLLARYDEEAGAQRRAVRSERDEATIRARLLLDTIVESATGLRRELALPAVAGSPGDRIERELATEGTREPTSVGSLAAADPQLLEQYLALPRARLLVDGYNVSKQTWPDLTLEGQRSRLLSGLAGLVARTGAETTVVFDAAATSTRPVVRTPRGVKVVFSAPGEIADDVIRRLVEAEPEGRVVVVATDDRAVLTDVARAGARTVGSRALAALLRA